MAALPPDSPDHPPEQEQLLLSPEGEGAFDAQLSLPLPQVEAPQPVTSIVKRDGRTEPFDKRKIAEAIQRAAVDSGTDAPDMAEGLASAVAIYLSKRLQGVTPTVDQVHDAVERVLIHMSNGRAALAYARHRDRRARIRRLREGDMRALLDEISEARASGRAPGGHRLLRTSGDGVTAWDRERIVSALVNETGLEQTMAEVIAMEVEQQIASARISTLTTSLVRELVSAKLVEHGLDAYREKHRRLGVPLYDAERIIRGTHAEALGHGPAGTDTVLARAAKREFALSEVFPPAVAEAHYAGALHVHHLGVVDRLHGAEMSLGDIAAHGIGLPGTDTFAEPPRTAEDLLGQFVRANVLYEDYFAEGLGWPAVDYFLAPFLRGQEGKALDEFARVLVYEFAFRAISGGEGRRAASIGLHWKAPAWLANEAVRGLANEEEGAYGALAHTAQGFCWALLEVLRKGGAEGITFPAPVPRIALEPGFFGAPGHETYLQHVAGLAVQRKPLAVHFVEDGTRPASPWRPFAVYLQQVSLNLPRAAIRGEDEAGLLRELDRLLGLAVEALEAKLRFLDGLLDRGADGPLGLLAVRREGERWIDLRQAVGLAGVDGLNECIRLLLNRSDAEAKEAADLADRILSFLARRCREHGARTGIPIALAQNNDNQVSARFARVDVADHPKTAAGLVATEAGDCVSYTTGARLRQWHEMSPAEAVRAESALHAHLAIGAASTVSLPDSVADAGTVVDFIRKVHTQTASKGIVFV